MPKRKTNSKPKNKSKTKVKRTVRSRQPNRPRTRMRNRPNITTLVRKVCSIVDPFCDAARTAKYPDGSLVRSLLFPQRYLRTTSTDASGNATILFSPGYDYSFASGTVSGTTATYTTYTAVSGGPSFTSPDAFRVNSFGLMLRSTCTPLTASGTVRIRIFPSAFMCASVDIATMNAVAIYDIPLSRVNNFCITAHPMDETFKQFANPAIINSTSNVADTVSNGWPAILISVQGGPASVSCLDVSVYINMEITFQDNDATAQLATPSPAINLPVQQAASLVQRAAGYFFTAGIAAVDRVVTNIARTALSSTLGPAVSAIPLLLD